MHTPIAIIGCGMAGLAAAHHLTEAGLSVQLFDKSRGSGGRLASRRTEYGDIDLGAQYFTVRDRAFRQAVHQWEERGCLQVWAASLYQRDESGQLLPSGDAQERFIGVPRMSALTRCMLGELPARLGCRIVALQRNASAWHLQDEHGQCHGPYSAVIVATPPQQACALIQDVAPHLARNTASIEMQPTWAAAFVFEQALDTPVDGCFVRSGPLDWLARNAGKPQRSDSPDIWVVHAGIDWSRQQLELPAEDVAEQLRGAMAEILGCAVPEATYSIAHRWRYARTGTARQLGALADSRLDLYLCGDWCQGGRVEGAWLSGREAARRLLSQQQ